MFGRESSYVRCDWQDLSGMLVQHGYVFCHDRDGTLCLGAVACVCVCMCACVCVCMCVCVSEREKGRIYSLVCFHW